MEKYDFDTVYKRNDSEKWMELERKFGAKDLISLWEADMDFMTARPLVDAVVARAKEGIYGYVHKSGEYNEAIIEWYAKQNGYKINTEWILHTPMIMTAVVLYLDLFCHANEKVVFSTPIYYPFYDVVESVGKKALFNPLIYNEGRYDIDFDDLEEQFQNGGKIYILCNPHNPGGSVWTRGELTKLGNLCRKYHVQVIADEAHADLVFQENQFVHFASLADDFAQTSITLLSPGKTFNLAGTHQAIIIVPNKQKREAMAKKIDMLDIGKNNIFSMVAVKAGYEKGEDWLRQVMAYIEANMEYTIQYCEKYIPEIKAYKPEGTYLMWLDCRNLSMDGPTLQNFMVTKAKVGLCEGHWFGEDGAGFERLNAACPRAILDQALQQIRQAVDRWRSGQ